MDMSAKRDTCPVCSTPLSHGFAYLSFGAVRDILLRQRRLDDDDMEGFCHIGYHGVRSDMTDSMDYCVAKDIKGGQLDIQFCSLKCLKNWFCGIVDVLESELASKAGPSSR